MIPKTIYYTHENREIVKKFEDQIKYSKSKNENYKFIFYDNDARITFIKEYFPEFYYFYERINKGYGAAKADIFRVLILYKYGGIYIDCKTQLENMDELFLKYPNKDLYTCSFKKDNKFLNIVNIINKTKYHNFFIASEKKGEVISAIKNEIFYRLSSYGKIKINKNTIILNKMLKLGDETSGMLAVFTYTGPSVFTHIIKKFPESIFDVASANKQYVIYNSHKSFINRLVFDKNDYKNSYHFNKRPFLIGL
jgi:mannosyltransferase OCH1-like enzyme